MKHDKGKKKRTNVELWYDIWGDLFPNEALPATPYVGTGGGDLVGAWITEYIARGGDEVSDVGFGALMGLLAYVNARSREKGPVNVLGEGNVSGQLSQGIQAHTHQHPSLPTSSFGPIMDSFELPDQRSVTTYIGNAPMLGSPMELQVPSNFEATGQHSAFLDNSDAYPSAPTHEFGTAPQLPPDEWLDMRLTNSYLSSLAAPADPTGVVYGGWMDNH